MAQKIIVAVHGIGNQSRYATIQSVISQFCSFHGVPSAVPLGSFYTERKRDDQRCPLKLGPPYPENKFGELAFTEVYWADIPNKLVKEEHTLEEAKRWARTIVERLQLRSKDEEEFRRRLINELSNLKSNGQKPLTANAPKATVKSAQDKQNLEEVDKACSARQLDKDDYSMLVLVLDEMIQAIATLERLCYLADRADVFTFDLKKLLDNYLSDVQIVTEFREQRGLILEEFNRVMAGAYEFDLEAEIYIVAHSEGTVVSFLGLLNALCVAAPDSKPPWIKQVRGLMTFGSPIDTHLILWPDELWSDFENHDTNKWIPNSDKRIKWYNYYDKSDPVGYELDEAREWMAKHKWDEVFEFKEENDIGFQRYALPGKAHVDYWEDKELFKHFIENVVYPSNGTQNNNAESDFSKKHCKWWAPLLSYVVPYLGVGVLLFAAVSILYKALGVCLDPKATPEPIIVMFRNVLGMACLLYGVIVMVRIPRLTGKWQWHWLIVPALFALFAGLYFSLIPGDAGWKRFWVASVLLVTVLLLVKVKKYRAGGLRVLFWVGGPLMAVILAMQVIMDTGDRGPLWPLVLATVGFLYLWRLAALIFDLVFVWHLYIHSSGALKRMGEVVASPYACKQWNEAPTRKTKWSFKTGGTVETTDA